MGQSTELRPYVWEGAYARWRDDAPHDPGLCADVRAPWMGPGERLILRSCEIVGCPEAYLYDDHYPPAEPEGRGKHYEHRSFQWDASGCPERLWADCRVEGKGRFTVELLAEGDCVDIGVSIESDMDAPMGPIDWAFCAIGLESPSLRDPDHGRTFLFDGSRLRGFRDITGSPDTTIFTVEDGGIRHAVFNAYPPKVDNYDTVFTPEARSYWFKLDGQNIYENPQGPNGRGQTAGMWLVDRNTIFRERMTEGVVGERVLYRVSPDGQTLTWTGFNADRDSGHVVWDRISLP